MPARNPLPLADRREIPGPCLPPFETLRRLRAVWAALDRRRPGDSRRIPYYKPYIDRRGVWQPGPVYASKQRPLTIRECLDKEARRA